MLNGTIIHLREWCEADIQALSALRNDVTLQAQLMARARPNSFERVREWLTTRATQADLLLFVIAACDNDRVLGYVQAAALDLFQGHCELGICLARDVQGRGVATETLDLLHKHLRSQYGIRKIGLRVRADNARAIAFYFRAGYREVGRLADHYREGDTYIDVMLMERFLSDAPVAQILST